MALIIKVTGRPEQALRFLSKHGEFGQANSNPLVATVSSMLGLGFNEILEKTWATKEECEKVAANVYEGVEVLNDEPVDDEHEFDNALRRPGVPNGNDDLLEMLKAAGINPIVLDGNGLHGPIEDDGDDLPPV